MFENTYDAYMYHLLKDFSLSEWTFWTMVAFTGFATVITVATTAWLLRTLTKAEPAQEQEIHPPMPLAEGYKLSA